MYCLGIDTSNYTTSAAVMDMVDMTITHRKKLLPVPKGAKGLRQSEAVFHHTIQLPELIEGLLHDFGDEIYAVGVSDKPRDEEGSYMPCFLAGMSAARCGAALLHVPLYTFSHQAGHIAAALFSAGRLDLLSESFIAFHVSGGTTEALLVTPDEKNIFSTNIIAKSLDLKAGQVIDRVGVMLGLDFPAGAQLDLLSRHCRGSLKIKPSMKGTDCCLSGIENQCSDMLQKGSTAEEIAAYCIESVLFALDGMVQALLTDYGELPLVFSGGVMSNSRIRDYMTQKYHAFFAQPEFSSDNAAGIAVLTSLMEAKQ